MESLAPKFPKIPPETTKKILKILKEAGKYLLKTIVDKVEEKISKAKSYDPQKNTADDIDTLNRLVQECRSEFADGARKMEKEIKNNCIEMTDEIISMLEGCNSVINAYRVETIRRKLDGILDNINGSMSDHIERVISLDNSECVAVLRLPAGDLKGQRMQELKMKVFAQAIENVCKTTEQAVNDVIYYIEDSFKEKILFSTEQADKAKKQLEVLSGTVQTSHLEKEQIIAAAGREYALAELALSIMEGVDTSWEV